jgi:ribonuclease HII
MLSLKIEDSAWWDANFPHNQPSQIIGIDEAGYGCLAGSMFVAAVLLKNCPGVLLNDSKKLSAKQREISAKAILEQSLAKVYEVTSSDIDKGNIFELRFDAAKKAALDVLSRLNCKRVTVIMDGNKALNFDESLITGTEVQSLCLVKGDGKSASIAAASILAKHSKDKEMKGLSQLHPGYGFEKHQGYFTNAHFSAVCSNGLLPIHRKTFISEEKWSMIDKF